MRPYLNRQFFWFISAYVIAVRILYDKIESNSDIEIAKALISTFSNQVEDQLGLNFLSYTLHAHSHLGEQVKKHGPLHSHTLFIFEGALHQFKNYINGTKSFLEQLTTHAVTYKVAHVNNSLLNTDLDDLDSNKSINRRNSSLKFYLIGQVSLERLTEIEIHFFKQIFNLTLHEAVVGSRASINKRIFHSMTFSRRNEANSYTIRFIDLNNRIEQERFARIKRFIEYSHHIYAFVEEILIINDDDDNSTYILEQMIKENNLFSRFFKKVKLTDAVYLIDCSNITDHCILIDNGKELYLTKVHDYFHHD
jgi:hypothetical protein